MIGIVDDNLLGRVRTLAAYFCCPSPPVAASTRILVAGYRLAWTYEVVPPPICRISLFRCRFCLRHLPGRNLIVSGQTFLSTAGLVWSTAMLRKRLSHTFVLLLSLLLVLTGAIGISPSAASTLEYPEPDPVRTGTIAGHSELGAGLGVEILAGVRVRAIDATDVRNVYGPVPVATSEATNEAQRATDHAEGDAPGSHLDSSRPGDFLFGTVEHGQYFIEVIAEGIASGLVATGFLSQEGTIVASIEQAARFEVDENQGTVITMLLSPYLAAGIDDLDEDTSSAGDSEAEASSLLSEDGRKISGTVTVPSGTPDGWQTSLYIFANADQGMDGGGSASVSEDGKYEIVGLTPGKYRVYFSAPELNLIPQYWQNAGNHSEATLIDVTDSNAVGVDAEMQVGLMISGSVTVPSGTPDGWHMSLHISANSETGGGYGNASLSEDGTYVIAGLAPGKYRVHFSAFGSNLVSQYWKNALNSVDATVVDLTTGDAVGIDAMMQQGHTISGTVTVPSGTPDGWQDSTYVMVAGDDGNGQGSTRVSADGTYTVSGLPAGKYRVQFSPIGSNLVPQYWEGSLSASEATLVDVAAGDVVGIDAELEVGSTLSGIIAINALSPIWNNALEVLNLDGSELIASTAVSNDGGFEIQGLPAGQYRLVLRSWGPDYYAMSRQYLRNGSSYQWNFIAGQALNVNPVAQPSSSVTGRVTGTITEVGNRSEFSTGVTLYQKLGNSWVADRFLAERSESGSYKSALLPAGEYAVAFDEFDCRAGEGFFCKGTLHKTHEWYNKKFSLASAEKLVLATGQQRTGIDGTIDFRPVIIGGTVSVSGIPAVGNTLTVETANWEPANVAFKYQWKRAGSVIFGATSPAYVPVSADIGKNVSVTVTGELAGAVDVVKTSGSMIVTSAEAAAVVRYSGSSRFETSAEISKQNFEPGVEVAFIANGMGFPDALAGAPVAAKVGGPVLLSEAQSLPAAVQTELSRLKPAKIIVLGGPGVVSVAVQQQLQQYTVSKTPASVERWFGENRFATAAQISKNAFSVTGGVAYVANGMNFPDSLSGAPVAGKTDGPVLPVEEDRISSEIEAELGRLRPAKIVVLGGPGVVSAALQQQLQQYTASKTPDSVERWFGESRFATAAKISQQSFSQTGGVAYVANGYNFPDSLSGAPVAGKNDGPVLPVEEGRIPAEVKAELSRLKPAKIVVLGGTGVVSAAVQSELASYIR